MTDNDNNPAKGEKPSPELSATSEENQPVEAKENTSKANNDKAPEKADDKPVQSTPVAPAEKKPDAKTKSAEKMSQTTSGKTASGSNILSLLLGLVLLLVIAVLAAGAYFGWQFWQEQDARVARIESGLEQKTQQDRSLASQANQQIKGLEQQRKALSGLEESLRAHQQAVEQRLNAQATRLGQLSGENRDIWMLEEARYLLRLANQRRLTSGGVEGIVGLLESADKLLLAIDRPDIFPLRESLRKDILRLKLAPVVDREGIYLALSALISQTDALPRVPYVKETPKASPSESPSEQGDEPAGIWASIKASFGQLDDYIRVKQHDEPLELWVSEVQQQLVAQNLRLMFEQAQSALLREEEAVYRNSLAQAITWINKHYAHFDQKSALVDAISEQRRKVIVSQLPDISASLIQLSQYIERAENSIAPAQQPNQEPSAEQENKETAL